LSRRPVLRQLADLERRATAGLHCLPSEVKEIEGAREAQRVVGEGNRQQQGSDAKRGEDHVDDEAERDAAERNETCRRSLADRTGDQVDHVRPRRQHHAERDQGKAGKVLDFRHEASRSAISGRCISSWMSGNAVLVTGSIFS
jgi:hypothetical protein